MNIIHVAVKDLEAFVNSLEFKEAKQVPITHLRAFSQTKNPRAAADQTALIAAYSNEKELIGYIGALPDILIIDGIERKIAWNSCWWGHPEKGKQIVMQLLLELFKAYDYQICFSDLGEHSKKIIAFTKKYHTYEYPGYRVFLRIYLHQLLPAKYSIMRNSLVKGLLYIFDFSVNLAIKLFQFPGFGKTGICKVVKKDSLSEKEISFIDQFPKANISQRGKEDFSWAYDKTWISVDTKVKKQYKNRYFFSYHANVFENYFLQVTKDQQMLGLIAVQNRNGHYRFPYVFANEGNTEIVFKAIMNWVYKKNANSYATYYPHFLNYIDGQKASLKKQKVVRYAAFPIEYGKIGATFLIQDGDGDAVFC